VTANIEIEGGLLHAATREEIKERQGIEVDDDNEPAPKSALLSEYRGPVPSPGNWYKAIYCPHRANTDFSDQEGRFINHRWDAIADYNELDLFRMFFLDEWVINVLIPMMNKELSKKMDLQEFYVFLGCIFLMACFDGVPDREMWWSPDREMFNMFEEAYFGLNASCQGVDLTRFCIHSSTPTRKRPCSSSITFTRCVK
jgi:hypothetical protein